MLDIQRPLWRFEAEGLKDITIIGFSSFSVGDLIQNNEKLSWISQEKYSQAPKPAEKWIL